MTPQAESSSTSNTSRSTRNPPVSEVSESSTRKEGNRSQQRVSQLLQNWGSRNKRSGGKPSEQNNDYTAESSEKQPLASMSSPVEELIGLGRKTSPEEQDVRNENTTLFQEQPPGHSISSPANTKKPNYDASAVEALRSGQGSKYSSSFSDAECQQESNAAAERKEDSSGLPPREDTAGSSPDTRWSLKKAKAKPPTTLSSEPKRNLRSARSESLAYLIDNRPVSQGVENWKGKMNTRISEPRERNSVTEQRSGRSPLGSTKSLPIASAGSSKGEKTKEKESMTTNNPHGSFINDTLKKKLAKALDKIAELSKAHDADRAQWQVSSVELVRVKKEHKAGLLEGYRQRMKIEGYETALTQKDSQLGSLKAGLIAKPVGEATSPGESTTGKSLSVAGEMEELQSTIVAKLTVENRRLLKERDTYQTQSRVQEKEAKEAMDDLESFLRTEVAEYKSMLDVAANRLEVAEKRVGTMEKSERMNNREAAKAFAEELAKSNEFQKREIDRLAMENHQLLEERDSLETQSRLMHKEEVDAFEKRQMETDSEVTLIRKEAAEYKALFQTSQGDRGISKSRISVLEKEFQNISQALNSSANDEALSSELTKEELNEPIEFTKQGEDPLIVEKRLLLDERESLLTRSRLQKEETEILEKCLKEMESKESSARNEVGEYKALLKTTQHEHEVSRSMLESMEKKLQRSDGEVTGSREAGEELKEMNEIQTQENHRLTMESRRLLKERESMQIQLRERIEEVGAQENRLNEMESKEYLLRKEIEDCRTIIEAAQHDYLESKKLSEELTKKNELRKNNIDRLAMESRQLLEERELIQTQLRERIEEIETLHNTQKEAASQESLDRHEVEEYRSSLEIAKDDNENFMKRIEEMEKKMEKITHDFECANSEAEGLKEDIEEQRKTNELQKEENDQLRNGLESQSGLLQSQSELIALLRAEAEVWDEERKTLKGALKQQNGKFETLSKELSQIGQDSKAIETSLRVELESSKAEQTAILKDKALEETQAVELLRNELEKAQTSNEEAQNTMAQFAEECESLRAKEQEQLEKITSLESQIKDATSSDTAHNNTPPEGLEMARCELAEKEVEISRDRIELLEHSLKAQQEGASVYMESIEFLEGKICQLEDTKIGVTSADAQEAVLEERSEPSCSVDEELQMSGKQTPEDHDHEMQQDETVEANKNAKESNSSTMAGGPSAADGIHLNQADYIKSIVARQKVSGVPNNKRGWAPRLSDVFSRAPGMNGDSIHDPARMDTLETRNIKLQSDLVKLQALYKSESYNTRKKLKELEEENLAILDKYAALVEKSGDNREDAGEESENT